MTALASATVGRILEGAVQGIRLLRRPRPVHPHGVVMSATIERMRHTAPSGIAWIDTSPTTREETVVRFSRSVGLPAPFPDILGLAIHTESDEASADILLASTDRGVPSRYLLSPHVNASRAWFSTIVPYRGTLGPVLVAARTLGERKLSADLGSFASAVEARAWTLQLLHARPTGRWHPFATMTLWRTADEPRDTDFRFDPVLRTLPGAATYAWTRRLREPSYALAQQRPPAAGTARAVPTEGHGPYTTKRMRDTHDIL